MQQEDKGIFYGLGRGIFIALIVVTLPAMGIAVYYDQINRISGDLADLPVFEDIQLHFLTGVELLGGDFAADLKRFYQLDSLAERPTGKNLPKFWKRPELSRDLGKQLSRKKQSHKEAYLDYIDRYTPIAIQEMRRTKIPASITLAQGLFESDAGRGFLARKANNHFGIKCRLQAGYRRDGQISRSDFDFHSLAYDCVQRKDDYAWDHFEVYETAANSFRRHSLLLQGDRYRWMIHRYEIGSWYDIPRSLFGRKKVPYYAAWAVGLKTSGYATAKNYAEQITAIIETYQLWKIDYEAIAE
jgi:flagellum-specific peptidoglycan hydrolase FlgJ